MKALILSLLFVAPLFVAAQENFETIKTASEKFQTELNADYKNPDHSPLTPEDLAIFTELPFFEIDSSFYVIAQFKRAKKKKTIKFKTSTDRRPKYEVYGTLTFSIHQKEYSLKVYQSESLREKEEFKDYLFLPFMDLTNGTSSYGGGRYIDLSIPNGETLPINFNTAYNPYCAYSGRYSCPVVPEENFLNIKIMAGVKAPKKH
jgi:uncharacterized protein (DUF1684 family)